MHKFYFIIICLLLLSACKTDFKKDRIEYSQPAHHVMPWDTNVSDYDVNNENQAVQIARHLFLQKDYHKAAKLLKPFYNKTPQDRMLANHLAFAYLNSGQMEKGRLILQRLDRVSDQSPLYLVNKALLSQQQDNLPAAKSFISYALNIDPNQPEYLEISGDIQLAFGDTALAIDNYARSLDLQMQETLLDKMVMTAYDYGAFDQAFSYLNKQYKMEPKAEKVLYHASLLFYAIDKKDTAHYLLQKALQLHHSIEYQLTQAEWLKDEKEYDRALNVISDLLQQDSTVMPAVLLAGRIYNDQYKYYDARKYYQKAIKIDSTNTIAEEELEKLEKKIAYLRIVKQKEENRQQIEGLQPLNRIEQ